MIVILNPKTFEERRAGLEEVEKDRTNVSQNSMALWQTFLCCKAFTPEINIYKVFAVGQIDGRHTAKYQLPF